MGIILQLKATGQVLCVLDSIVYVSHYSKRQGKYCVSFIYKSIDTTLMLKVTG